MRPALLARNAAQVFVLNHILAAMRQSNDTGHFFQTDSAISESERKNKKSKNEAGDPIRLESKLLAVIADPFSDGAAAVYVAEAAGTVKRVVLETKNTSHTLRPSTSTPSPFTSLAISQTSATSGTLFAGSWDKNIYAWSLASSSPSTVTSTAVLKGHTDFVKALLCIPATSKTSNPLLVSASADKSIIVWNATTFARLHTLTGHARGVQALALDPTSLPDALAAALPHTGDGHAVVVASGDSNREIRFWSVSAEHARQISFKAAAARQEAAEEANDNDKEEEDEAELAPLIAHETSIFDLQYSSTGELWTASADRTAKQLAPMRDFAEDTSLTHDDYVKAVAVAENVPAPSTGLSDADDAAGMLVVTASRDENVRVWNGTSGKCVACLRGHWEEVTGLALVANDNSGQATAVVSVGIDGTVRRWGLRRQDLNQAMDKYEDEMGEEGPKKEDKLNAGIALTEDEERELAELMDDDE